MSEQAPDPFENYAEQEHSYDLLGRHGEGLIEEALEYLREKPDGHPVGVVITLDAPEAALFLNPPPETPPPPDAVIACIMSREMVLRNLRVNAPNTLDFLQPKTEGRSRKLPLVAMTKNGYRFGAIDFELPW